MLLFSVVFWSGVVSGWASCGARMPGQVTDFCAAAFCHLSCDSQIPLEGEWFLSIFLSMASRGSTSSANGLSPPLSGNHHDEEAGPSKAFDHDDIHAPTSPFDIAHTKNAPFETLRRWRVILLLLLLQQQCLHIAIPFCISIFICSISYSMSIFEHMYICTCFIVKLFNSYKSIYVYISMHFISIT